MGILDNLQNNGSNYTKWDGTTPSYTPGSNPQSRLHYQYSINGNPAVFSSPQPSTLDLDGKTPPKYTDNLPK